MDANTTGTVDPQASEPQSAAPAWLDRLNEQQLQAVRHGDAPLLIVAGAGTGKTTTLAHRVAWLITQGADPRRMLLLTFTRRAAAEMLRRVDGITEQACSETGGNGMARTSARSVWGGTFHAIATRLLRQHGRLIGLRPDFTIFDRGDSEDLLNVCRSELKLDDKQSRFPLKGTCLDIYSRCINTRKKLSEILQHDFPWCEEHAESLKKLFQAYTERKEELAILDYDDLLLFWNALVHDEQGRDVVAGQFDHVLVDEYQDTNTLQAEILRGIKPDGHRLTVVGDDAQSIYSFRAATVRNILDFPSQFAGCRVLPLERNYRSTQPLLDLSNGVIALAAERHAKTLWTDRKSEERAKLVLCRDEDEQTDYVVDQVLQQRETGTDLKRQAVLFRAAHHSLALELELSRRNIPFVKYGGLRFIETAHVKDLLAFLRLAENPRDLVSAHRVLMLLPGIGRKRAGQLAEELRRVEGDFQAWGASRVPPAAALHWPLFIALMRVLSSPTTGETLELPTQIGRARTFYAPLLEQKFDHAFSRLRDLEQLEQVASRYRSRGEFLAEITLDPPSSTQDTADDALLDEDYLILSTIHSAKGLEWDAVHVLHAADGNIPSDMATGSAAEVEEERRLFYVALTRAKRFLHICVPQRYYFSGRGRSDAHSYAQITRFLPSALQGLCEKVIPGGRDSAKTETDGKCDLTTQDIRRKINDQWM